MKNYDRIFLGDVMGRKGFTLVELIATVAIISIVFGIASYSVFGIINSSKIKSEALFVEEISEAISQYISLNGSKLVKGSVSYKFKKCLKFNGNDKETCSLYTDEEVEAFELFSGSVNNSVKLSFLLEEDFFDNDKLINPVNKKNCLEGQNPNIRIFKDSDYVYYYYVNLSGSNTSCNISNENGIINTLDDNLRVEVGL